MMECREHWFRSILLMKLVVLRLLIALKRLFLIWKMRRIFEWLFSGLSWF
jgi:hypothetical protein